MKGAVRHLYSCVLLFALALAVFVEPVRAGGIVTNVLAQYATRLWQMEDGLPHTIVQAITQTRDGYLWVGTREGLARFDGNSFLRLTARDFGTGLVQPSVVCLCQTRDDSLWIGTENVGLFRLRQGRVSSFGRGEGLRGDMIQGLEQTADGSLWIAAGGLAQLKDGKLQYPFDKELGQHVSSLFLDHDGLLWVNSDTGIWRLQGERLMAFVLANGRILGRQRCLVRDRNGTVWAGQTGVLTEIRAGVARTYRKGDGAKGIVGALFFDRKGNLWVGAYAGVSRFVDGEFVAEKEELGEAYRVFCFFQDYEGNIWIGSEEGLLCLTPRYFTTFTKKEGLTASNVGSVCASRDGGVWVGVWGGGLNYFSNGTFTAFCKTNGLTSDFVMAVHEARDGSLWVGTDYSGGLTHIQEGRITRYQSGLDSALTALLEDEQGNLWIGSRDSLTCFKQGEFKRYTQRDGLSDNQINALCLGRGGVLWIGTRNGLTRWQNGRFENLAAHEPRLKKPILSLYEDGEGHLWIGTRGAGVLRWKTGLDSFTSDQGLFSDSIYAVLEDDRTNLWFNSSKGIFRVGKAQFEEVAQHRRASLVCSAYGRTDGIASSSQYRDVTQPGACKAMDGRLWFRSPHGVVRVDPNIVENHFPPPVVIQEVIADRKSVRRNDGRLAGAGPGVTPHFEFATLPPGRGELEIHYAALSFCAPEKNRFRYKLEGVDTDWVEAGNRRIANYNHLAPGEYRFQVIACNNDGIWNETGAALQLLRQAHFWQTRWFLGLCGLATAGGIWGGARYVIYRKMKRRIELLEQRHAIETERARIARDLHDDLGTRLTEALLLNRQGLRSAQNDPKSIRTCLEKAGKLLRELSQDLDVIVWAANPKNDSLDNFIIYLYGYLDSLAGLSPVQILRDVPAQVTCPLSATQRHNLLLVIKEALNNVFQHAGASTVWLRLRLEGGVLKVAIEDNGKGFVPGATSPQGNGLLNMEKRMKLIGGVFAVASEPGAGTRIRLELPLQAP